MADINFTLLENGLDSIATALRLISAATSKSDLKQAVLSLAAGIEQVIKARLAREDWRLLFSKPDAADKSAYETGTFRSIGFDECLKRLEESCDITFSPAEERKLRTFRERRHRLEHFAIRDTREAIESSAVEALAVLTRFIGESFDFADLASAERELFRQIHTSLVEFDEFTRRRLREIRDEVAEIRANYGGVIGCPSCLQEALATDVRVRCLFCGYADKAEGAARRYVQDVLGVSEHSYMDDGECDRYPLFWCPNCVNQALVDKGVTGGQSPSVQFECFACGWSWLEGQAEICLTCGQPKDRDRFVGDRCSDCDAAYIAQDHT